MIKPISHDLKKIKGGGYFVGNGHVYVGNRNDGLFLTDKCNFEIYSDYNGPDWMCDRGIAVCIGGQSGVSDVLKALKTLVNKLEGGDLDIPFILLPAPGF